MEALAPLQAEESTAVASFQSQALMEHLIITIPPYWRKVAGDGRAPKKFSQTKGFASPTRIDYLPMNPEARVLSPTAPSWIAYAASC